MTQNIEKDTSIFLEFHCVSESCFDMTFSKFFYDDFSPCYDALRSVDKAFLLENILRRRCPLA